MWRVIISSKEKDADDMVARLVDGGVEAARGHLEVADVAFQKDGRTHIQAEFKSLQDMLASLRDCRYHEQAAAMAVSQVPISFYVIHGLRAPPGVSEEEQLKLEHAMTRVQASAPGIATVYLTSQGGRAAWIRYVVSKLNEPENSGNECMAPLSEHVRHNFGTKHANRTQANVYLEQLGRINGISDRRAKALAETWPSWSALTQYLQSVESQAVLVQKLKDLGVGFGPVTIQRLYEQTLAPDQRPWEYRVTKKSKK